VVVPSRSRTRATLVLFSGVALATTAYIAAVTVSTLAARSMTGSARLAGLPGAVAVIGTAIGATVLASDIPRAGRRRGLIFGYLVAAAGGVVAAWAVVVSVYPLLLAGLFVLGVGQASSQLSRYAAAEIASVERRGSAVSLIVWAGTVGAVLGPSLLGPAGGLARSWGRAEYLGGFVIAGVFMSLACLTYLLGLRSESLPVQTTGQRSTRLEAAGEWRNPAVKLALSSMAFGQVVMVLMMTGTPIHIEDTGRGLEAVGLVISAHTVGMFAFSPLTGRIVDALGPVPVMRAAVAILAVAALVSAGAPDDSTPIMAFALFVLGVGWNAGFVAGSALLARTVGSRIQGSVDSLVWGSSAAASLGAGLILDAVGYRSLSIFSIALLVVPLVLLVRRRRLVLT
jgi:MFS family permease